MYKRPRYFIIVAHCLLNPANDNTPLGFIGIDGSPTCSIYWGPHKVNKYKTESIMEDDKGVKQKENTVLGVMTIVLDKMLKEKDINIPYLEAPVKSEINSEMAQEFIKSLDALFPSRKTLEMKENNNEGEKSDKVTDLN